MAGRKKSASPSPAGEGVVAKRKYQKKSAVANDGHTEQPVTPAEHEGAVVADTASDPIGDQAKSPDGTESSAAQEMLPAAASEPVAAEPEQETDVFTPVVLSITNNSPSKQNIAKVQIAPNSTVEVEVATEKRLNQIKGIVEQLNSVSRKSGWGERITLAQV